MALRKRSVLPMIAAAAVASFPILAATAACHSFSFTQDTYTVNEQAGSVTLTVERDNNLADSSVEYHTVNGTATAPKDYKKEAGATLEYTGEDLQKQFQVQIEDDGSDEQNEVFTVVLDGGSGCAVNPSFRYDNATVRILDNDEKAVALPTPTPTPTKPKPKPKPSTASASPTPTPSSPSPTVSASAIAAADTGDEGLSGGALAGIMAGTLALGGAAAFWVRSRFLT